LCRGDPKFGAAIAARKCVRLLLLVGRRHRPRRGYRDIQRADSESSIAGLSIARRRGMAEGVLKYSYRGLPCDGEPGRAGTNNGSVDSIFEFKPPARELG